MVLTKLDENTVQETDVTATYDISHIRAMIDVYTNILNLDDESLRLVQIIPQFIVIRDHVQSLLDQANADLAAFEPMTAGGTIDTRPVIIKEQPGGGAIGGVKQVP
jgi:hypothetical protein